MPLIILMIPLYLLSQGCSPLQPLVNVWGFLLTLTRALRHSLVAWEHSNINLAYYYFSIKCVLKIFVINEYNMDMSRY